MPTALATRIGQHGDPAVVRVAAPRFMLSTLETRYRIANTVSRRNYGQRMLHKDLIALIEQGVIDKVVICRSAPNQFWAVAGYGTTLPNEIVNRVELNDEGCIRLWADLDAAYSFIRKCGFQQPILIDG